MNITTKINNNPKLVGVDLFCGVGGMSLGFANAGIDVKAALDFDPVNIEMHEKNFPKCRAIQADLSKVSGDWIRKKAGLEKTKIDIVFGGPPCQGFSMIGKRNVDDPRSELLKHFVRIAGELNTTYFVIENVAGLLLGETKKILDQTLTYAEKLGYEIVKPIQILNAADFEVPQNRKRVFIIGYKKGFAAPSYPIKSENAAPNVWDAIGDLSKIRGNRLFDTDTYVGKLGAASIYSEKLRGRSIDNQYTLGGCLRTRHSEESIRRFKSTDPGGQEEISRFYRLSKAGLSNTLRAGSGKSHGSYTAPRPIHPTQARCITVREAARLHSFPDWFEFHPTRWHGFRQVGNSVPPLLAKTIADAIVVSYIKNSAKAG